MKFILLLICSVSFTSCWMIRGARIGKQDISDYKKLPLVNFTPNETVSLIEKNENESYKIQNLVKDRFIAGSKSYALIVLKNNNIIYEKYFNGKNENTIFPAFSFTKSITATLLFMAIDEGKIESIYDPVTKYLPQLAKRDYRFTKLTLHELLNMRSGIKFDDPTGNGSPIKLFSKFAHLAVGCNNNKFVKKLKLEKNPSEDNNFTYQNINSQVIANIIEVATGKSLQNYFTEKLWIPLGMEGKGSWNIDDIIHKKVKGFAAFNTISRNYARFAQLYCNYGIVNGKIILQKKWIDSMVNGNLKYKEGYELHFWKDDALVRNFSNIKDAKLYYSTLSGNKKIEKISETNYLVQSIDPSFSAQGSYGQVAYINPITQTIIIHNGWHNSFDGIIKQCKKIDEKLK